MVLVFWIASIRYLYRPFLLQHNAASILDNQRIISALISYMGLLVLLVDIYVQHHHGYIRQQILHKHAIAQLYDDMVSMLAYMQISHDNVIVSYLSVVDYV